MVQITSIGSVRHAVEKDIDAIVRVHLQSFPDFFLTFLGPRFLKLLYSEVAREQGSVVIVSESSRGNITGFVAGVENQSGLYKRLAKKKWLSFAIASSWTALRNPSITPRLVRALTYVGKASAAVCPALLMSIAVLPETEGKGTGRLLVREFLSQMHNRGVGRVCLTTDRDTNDRTNTFYKKIGFSIAREFITPEGRWMNEYVIETKAIIE